MGKRDDGGGGRDEVEACGREEVELKKRYAKD